MNYILAVLTHGRGSTLNDALRAFRDNTESAPGLVLVYSDGGFDSRDVRREAYSLSTARSLTSYRRGPRQQGFCHATAALWEWATAEAVKHDYPYVFWLEHDFVLLRQLDLAAMAAVLDYDSDLAQMQLMRNAVSEPEFAAGGLFESRRGEYEQRHWFPPTSMETAEVREAYPYLHHRSYFTTNPSLMRRDFMASHPFKFDSQPHCEGRYGIELVRQGFQYGVWGDGSPWVEHIGVRSGSGY